MKLLSTWQQRAMTMMMMMINYVIAGNVDKLLVTMDKVVEIGHVLITILQGVFMLHFVGSNQIVGSIILMVFVNMGRDVQERIVGSLIGIRISIIDNDDDELSTRL